MADTVSWSTRRPTSSLISLIAVVISCLFTKVTALSSSEGGVLERSAQWPNGPLVTSGRWITDATGAKITYAGVNWPGSLETMIPEGLQYQSVETIVSKVKGLGMNAIRLTYATEMIDKYYDNGKTDVSIRDAFIAALGQAEGMAVYDKVVAKNPSFGPNTTRLQVYDAIAAECAKHEIYLHLDNHVSKSGWCCTPLDGNSWWGDTFFDTDKWTRGLSFMAEHGKAWPSLVSMSLRNELRPPLTSAEASGTYNWETWYRYMRQGADAVHSANPDVLIFLSGLDTDSNLTAVVQGSALEPGTAEFSRDDFKGYGHSKLVLELHAYDNIITTPTVDCSVSTGKLFDAGFQTFSKDAANRFPLVVTEFGTPQDTGAATNSYISCILDYFSSERAGWMIWSLGGSYYIREGSRDVDESWGILSHDWSSLRSPDFVNQKLKPAIEASQAPLTEDDDYEESGASNDSDDSQTGDTADEGNAAASSLTKSPFVTVVSVVVAVALISHLL